MATERQKEIKRRRHRRDKIFKLRKQLEATTNARQRKTIIQKIQRTSRYAPVPES